MLHLYLKPTNAAELVGVELPPEVKEYKENPNNYKGHVGDICEMIRYAITSLHQTPDLYEIEKILGLDEIKRRLSLLESR
mgnify:CR=1 FL=1